MKTVFRSATLCLCLATWLSSASVDGQTAESAATQRAAQAKEKISSIDETRKLGWQITSQLLAKIETKDLDEFPGSKAFFAEVKKQTEGISLEKDCKDWPALDVDQLITKNPNFWQTYYEVAPGDPGLYMIHAGLLMTAGELVRASHQLIIAQHVSHGSLDRVFKLMRAKVQGTYAELHKVVKEGVKLHDAQEYEKAQAKYQEAMKAWPQNGLAHFEFGMTALTVDMDKAKKAGKPIGHSQLVLEKFEISRRHDPLQLMAYQGDNELVKRLLVLKSKLGPAFKKLQLSPGEFDADTISAVAQASQEAELDALALTSYQMLVANHGEYQKQDFPFLEKSLKRLVPGPTTDETLKRLGSKMMTAWQIIPSKKK